MTSKRPLHLLVVGTKWPPETFIERMIEGVRSQGFEVSVATAERPTGSWRRKIQWIWAPSWHQSRWRRWLFFAFLLIKGLLRRKKGPNPLRWPKGPFNFKQLFYFLPFWKRSFDVAYYPWLMSGPHYLYLIRQLPTTTSFRGSHTSVAPLNPKRRAQVEEACDALASVRRIHSVCYALQNDGERLWSVPSQKVEVIYTGIDTEMFVPARPHEKKTKLRIAWVGNLSWVKGIETALVAIKMLADRKVPARLTVVGDGPERQRMHYTVMDLELDDHVTYLGKQTPEAVRDVFHQSDVLLLTSLSEGIANVVVEAMACGLPVVVTDVGGMREAVDDGVEGFVVPMHAPDAMADALERLANDPALRLRMGKAARQRALRQFDLKNQGPQFAQFFRNAVEPS